MSKSVSRNSTCSRSSTQVRDALDHKYQSNGFQGYKKMQVKNHSNFEQTCCSD